MVQKKYDRLGEAVKFPSSGSTVFCAVWTAAAVFSGPMISKFTKGDLDMIRWAGPRCGSTVGLSFVLLGFIRSTHSCFWQWGKRKRAVFLGACRQGIYFVPVILILPGIWGLNGILYAQPVAGRGRALIQWEWRRICGGNGGGAKMQGAGEMWREGMEGE